MSDVSAAPATPRELSRAQLLELSSTATHLELHDLALDLSRAALARPGVPAIAPEDLACDLVLAGRHPEATRVLDAAWGGARQLPDLPGPGQEVRAEHLAWAAASAASGDLDARRWLTDRLAEVPDGPRGVLVARLLRAVADACGDRDLADSMAFHLGRCGVTWGAVAGQLAVARMSARNRRDAQDTGEALGQSVGVLRAGTAVLERDPQAVVDAVDELVRRGDTAGARLVLLLVDRMHPGVARIEGLRERVEAEHGGPSRAGRAVRMLLVPLVPAPGLTRTETRVWWDLRRRRIDPRTGNLVVAQASIGWPLVYGLVALAGFVLGVIVAGQALQAWRAVLGTGAGDGAVAVVLWLAGLLGAPLASVWGARRLRGAWSRRRRRLLLAREEEQAATLARRCDCLSEQVVLGLRATAYAGRHLVRDSGQPLPGRSDLRLFSCPTTGLRWLEVSLAPEGATGLLRSSGDRGDDAPADDRAGDVVPGMYL